MPQYLDIYTIASNSILILCNVLLIVYARRSAMGSRRSSDVEVCETRPEPEAPQTDAKLGNLSFQHPQIAKVEKLFLKGKLQQFKRTYEYKTFALAQETVAGQITCLLDILDSNDPRSAGILAAANVLLSWSREPTSIRTQRQVAFSTYSEGLGGSAAPAPPTPYTNSPLLFQRRLSLNSSPPSLLLHNTQPSTTSSPLLSKHTISDAVLPQASLHEPPSPQNSATPPPGSPSSSESASSVSHNIRNSTMRRRIQGSWPDLA
ncbi:hypothetical protein VKT23_008060 [Stygiomarasmius scandens]|uniref:Uncharacterized protein n=1 Tax=Marasmiellus scandens TaxID=2682957 RepID=A0ABR1JLD4_9AGAR